MNLFASFSLISFIIVSFAGVYAYFENPKSNINRFFAIYCLLVAYWCFTEFMYRNAPNFQTAYLWTRFHVAAGAFLGPGFFHFALVFTEKKKYYQSKLFISFIYAVAFITFYILSLTTLAIGKPALYSYGWFYTYGPYYFIVAGWDILFALIGMVVIFTTYFKTTDLKKKGQILFVFYGFFFPVSFAIITGLLFPALNVDAPLLLSTGFSLMIAVISYAISKYELFALNPATAADNIVSTMADSLVIMDSNGNILTVNKATLDLLGYKEKELINTPAGILFEDKSLLKRFMSQNWMIRNYETKFITKSRNPVPVLFSTSAVLDKKGNIAGIVGIANNITERYISNTLQEALLEVPKEIEGVDFGTLYRSATEAAKVGGDFYDIFELSDDKIGIVVGDISGKGIEAANLTSVVKNTIRAYAFLKESPASVVERTNDVIKKFSAPRTFVTVFFGILNAWTGELVYCSAGHPLALLKKGVSNEVQVLLTSSTVIGMFKGQKYFNDYEKIDIGDFLILYTDGVTEAKCKEGFFGEEKLVNLVKKLSFNNANEYPEAIYNVINDCTQGNLSDDIVLLSLSRKITQAKAA